ncbi:MAG: cobalamin-binding protein [Planctomycetota bacterium]|nr:MAG: cobalamin-binding protein [Planctomycetota bacterium]
MDYEGELVAGKAVKRAKRIVSLLPSATEIVCALGVSDRLVGVSHECDYPSLVSGLPQVTHPLIPTDASGRQIDEIVREQLRSQQALYALDRAALEELQPDLIITQSLCDVCAVAEDEVLWAVRTLPSHPQVINLEPQALADVFASIRHLARVIGVDPVGEEVVTRLEDRVNSVMARSQRLPHRPRVAFLEWLDPPFSSGHWTPELVHFAGGIEALGKAGERSRTLSWDDVLDAQPEVLAIACCGFDTERALRELAGVQTVPQWRELPAVRAGRVYIMDGSQYFNRPGPRLVDSLELLAHALHPETHRLPAGLPAPLRVPGVG